MHLAKEFIQIRSKLRSRLKKYIPMFVVQKLPIATDEAERQIYTAITGVNAGDWWSVPTEVCTKPHQSAVESTQSKSLACFLDVGMSSSLDLTHPGGQMCQSTRCIRTTSAYTIQFMHMANDLVEISTLLKQALCSVRTES